MPGRALRGLRDLHLVSPSAQRAVLKLRGNAVGARPPRLPGAVDDALIGFMDTASPSFLTDTELESIESIESFTEE